MPDYNLGLAARLESKGLLNARVADLIPASKRCLDDAKALVLASRYHGAYYLAGYALEAVLCAKYASLAQIDDQRIAKSLISNIRGVGDVKSNSMAQHDLMIIWSAIANVAKKRKLSPKDLHFLRNNTTKVKYVYEAWNVKLRYLAESAEKSDAENILTTVERVTKNLFRNR